MNIGLRIRMGIAILSVSFAYSASALAMGIGNCPPSDQPADPCLGAEITELGDGLYLFDVTVYANDGEGRSFFLEDMAFSGHEGSLISQRLFFGLIGSQEVDTDEDAAPRDGIGDPAYQASEDSWFHTENYWPVIFGITQEENLYSFTGGTSSPADDGLKYFSDVAPLGHIVVAGEALDYEGIINRKGVAYNVSGTFVVPEPGTAMLLSLGLTGITVLGRRRS
jgi:hypothetical protein